MSEEKMISEYPKFMYSSEGSILLKSAEEEKALKGSWVDSPAKLKKVEKKEEKAPVKKKVASKAKKEAE